MKCDSIDILLKKYYEGETTLAEERQLSDFFNQTTLLPDHLKSHAQQFKYYTHKKSLEMDKYLSDEWLFEKIKKSMLPVRQHYNTNLYWRVAASVAFLLITFWGGKSLYTRLASQQDSEVQAIRHDIQEIKEVLATSSMPSSLANDRIQVIRQEFGSTQKDEIIDLLVNTMNHDLNVNVRLAACEALYQFKNEPKVRQAYIQSLPIQTNPIIQITLIDILVGINEIGAVRQLQKLMDKENVMPLVKDKAKQGIGILI